MWLRRPPDWGYTYTALVAEGYQARKCYDNLYLLRNKEDPSTWAYGVNCGKHPCNLTPTKDRGGYLSAKEPIKISYNRKQRTVKFTLGNDVY